MYTACTLPQGAQCLECMVLLPCTSNGNKVIRRCLPMQLSLKVVCQPTSEEAHYMDDRDTTSCAYILLWIRNLSHIFEVYSLLVIYTTSSSPSNYQRQPSRQFEIDNAAQTQTRCIWLLYLHGEPAALLCYQLLFPQNLKLTTKKGLWWYRCVCGGVFFTMWFQWIHQLQPIRSLRLMSRNMTLP